MISQTYQPKKVDKKAKNTMTPVPIISPLVEKDVILVEQASISKELLEKYLLGSIWDNISEAQFFSNLDEYSPELRLFTENYPRIVLVVTTEDASSIFQYDLTKTWRLLALDLHFWETRSGYCKWLI